MKLQELYNKLVQDKLDLLRVIDHWRAHARELQQERDRLKEENTDLQHRVLNWRAAHDAQRYQIDRLQSDLSHERERTRQLADDLDYARGEVDFS